MQLDTSSQPNNTMNGSDFLTKKDKKKKGHSVQDLIGITKFTQYGVETNRGELVFYAIAPTNISVLSSVNIENKIRHFMMLLSALPDIEFACTDASECFDNNKMYLQSRYEEEPNSKVKKILKNDMDFLDDIQIEMATARQFIFVTRYRSQNPEHVFSSSNKVEKLISEQGFEVRRMRKEDIKRFFALYFGASMNGEKMPDVDGEQFISINSS